MCEAGGWRNSRDIFGIRVSKERHPSCPLVEVEDQYEERTKKANWITTKDRRGTTLYECEVCHQSRLQKTNYCPWCGAKMKNRL